MLKTPHILTDRSGAVRPLAGNLYFKYQEFDSQFLRLLGSIYFHGADLGECYATASQITDGSYESWYECWQALAGRIHRAADASLAQNCLISACQGYLRACNYYRTAEFFLREDLNDPRIIAAAESMRACFYKAGELLHTPFKPIEVPYLSSKLPGYFFRPSHSTNLRPTIVFVGGYDSYIEESYFLIAAAAMERGYHVVSVDGPGQGHALRRNKLYLRYDWETVVKPIVDYTLKLPGVDPKRLILMGRSLGGFLATRAATAEHRIAALVVDPGQYDLGQLLKKKMPPEFFDLLREGKDQELDDFMQESFEEDRQLRFFFTSRMQAHGVHKMSQYFRQIMNFTAAGLLNRIRCPTLICSASSDSEKSAQSTELFQQLTCPKSLITFHTEEGAGDHCELGAPALFSQRVFDWLDRIL
jgi:pimeloyl-ACP methyl ester carboxylesterase